MTVLKSRETRWTDLLGVPQAQAAASASGISAVDAGVIGFSSLLLGVPCLMFIA
jgi:hypothetical protein